MKFLVALLLLGATSAHACNYTKRSIERMLERGEVTITFNKNGTVNEVTCDTKKFNKHACEHKVDAILGYYKGKKG